MSRIVLAMSGGVDSSVAAHLLKKDGHDVIGVFMRHGQQSPVACNVGSDANEDAGMQLPVIQRLDHRQGCCTAADADDARRVADKLDIPFYALNLDEDFSRIIDYFVKEYTSARTPNPCVVCNNWIKFGKLFDYADSVGAEFVATGHYAQLANDTENGPTLLRGHDGGKDQSYVLFGIKRKFLPRMMLPIGEFDKSTIRDIATEIGMRVADKPDSQEICFVTQGRYNEFVRDRREEVDTSGEIVTTDGTVVGHHPGIEGFTVGQRRKLGVSLGEPRFVVRIELDTRRVVIGERDETTRTELSASGVNWHVDLPKSAQKLLVQVRYNSTAVSALVEPIGEDRFHVKFDEPCYSVSPGQAVVCYDGNRLLGGGWID